MVNFAKNGQGLATISTHFVTSNFGFGSSIPKLILFVRVRIGWKFSHMPENHLEYPQNSKYLKSTWIVTSLWELPSLDSLGFSIKDRLAEKVQEVICCVRISVLKEPKWYAWSTHTMMQLFVKESGTHRLQKEDFCVCISIGVFKLVTPRLIFSIPFKMTLLCQKFVPVSLCTRLLVTCFRTFWVLLLFFFLVLR